MGDPLRFFNTHSVAKHEKIGEKTFCFREKIAQCRKKLKGGTLWNFSTSILSQNIKNQSRMCGKGVGLGLFPEVEKWPFFDHFWDNFGYVSHIPAIRF